MVEVSGYFGNVPITETIRCRRAVTGRFRSQITFLDVIEGALGFRRLAPLRPLHTKLLSGVALGGSISKVESDKLTSAISSRNEPMTDGPRRWRELRTEYGFDVAVISNRYYRGVSAVPITEPQPRPDMANLKRQILPFLVAEGVPLRCNKCGRAVGLEKTGEDFPGLIDHRRPVLFGGGDEPDTLQFSCQQCNNLKARICNTCPLGYHCETCTWAYPEKFHDTVVVNLSPEIASALERFAAGKEKRVEQVVKDVLYTLLPAQESTSESQP